jgi:hypothetical protein
MKATDFFLQVRCADGEVGRCGRLRSNTSALKATQLEQGT